MKVILPARFRGMGWLIIWLTILWVGSGCQTTAVLPSATPILLTPTPRPALAVVATQPPRQLFAPTETQPTTAAPQETPRLTQAGLVSPPTARPTQNTNSLSEIIGYSAGGRAITVERFGDGERRLLLIGGMHGGWETNTISLMQMMITHFREQEDDVLADIQLLIIPVANPDGYELGRTARGRFNGNGVDLNRNWSCEWSPEAYWRREQVDPGAGAFSEPETRAIADFILATHPVGVLFYHSAANGVFPGNCGDDHGSRAFGAAYAEAAGYNCCAAFSAYPVTGTAATWADGEGIPAADVELTQSDDPEFEQNLRAVMAIQEWIAGQ